MAREALKRKEIVAWEPQPGPQDDFIHAKWCREVLYGGARGGGKSDAIIGDYLQDVFTYGEHWQGIIFRRTYSELEHIISRAKQIYPMTGAEWRAGDKRFLWPNGASVKFRYLEREDDADRYQGHSYSYVAFDELTQWPSDKAYKKLIACLRSGGAKVDTMRIRATANPGGVGHHWVKARFIDHNPFGYDVMLDADTGHERMFIPARVEDNKLLVKNDPDYVSRLRGIGSPELVRAWLEGDWNIVIGSYFPEFSIAKHVIEPFEIPHEWLRGMGFDWGSARPFAAVWGAVSTGEGHGQAARIPRGAMVIYREAYGGRNNEGWRWHAEQVADYLRGIEGQDKPTFRRADPAIFAEDGGPSIAERMAKRGLVFAPGDNKRVPGWDQYRARFEGEDGRPMLYVFSTCREFIRTIPALQHDEHKPEDIDTESDDHIADAGRYLLMGRPYARPKAQQPADIKRRPTINDLWQAKEGERPWS